MSVDVVWNVAEVINVLLNTHVREEEGLTFETVKVRSPSPEIVDCVGKIFLIVTSEPRRYEKSTRLVVDLAPIPASPMRP